MGPRHSPGKETTLTPNRAALALYGSVSWSSPCPGCDSVPCGWRHSKDAAQRRQAWEGVGAPGRARLPLHSRSAVHGSHFRECSRREHAVLQTARRPACARFRRNDRKTIFWHFGLERRDFAEYLENLESAVAGARV